MRLRWHVGDHDGGATAVQGLEQERPAAQTAERPRDTTASAGYAHRPVTNGRDGTLAATTARANTGVAEHVSAQSGRREK